MKLDKYYINIILLILYNIYISENSLIYLFQLIAISVSRERLFVYVFIYLFYYFLTLNNLFIYSFQLIAISVSPEHF